MEMHTYNSPHRIILVEVAFAGLWVNTPVCDQPKDKGASAVLENRVCAAHLPTTLGINRSAKMTDCTHIERFPGWLRRA